jgi:hypothetical protein
MSEELILLTSTRATAPPPNRRFLKTIYTEIIKLRIDYDWPVFCYLARVAAGSFIP